jgi:hypothetical protein
MPAYSKTPLEKKLGIKIDDVVHIHNGPNDYFEKLEVNASDYHLERKPQKETLDFAHVFVSQREELESIAEPCMNWLRKSGMLWVSCDQDEKLGGYA